MIIGIIYINEILVKRPKNELENIQKHLVVCWEKLLFAMYDLNTVVGPGVYISVFRH